MQGRTAAAAIAAILWASSAQGIGTGEDITRRGDANTDGVVDNSDPTAILNYVLLGTFSPTCLDACDANDDGAVDQSDAVYLWDFLFYGGPPPPAPGPFSCGSDPTQDDLGCDDGGCE